MSAPPSSTGRVRCRTCGAPLTDDACPACSLRFLLDEPELDVVPRDERPPEERYRITKKIASGGMGVVWAAEDTVLGRTVALKMLRSARFAEEGEMARFSIEAAAAAGLDHPHIVPVYEAGRLDGQPYFTMKLIEGGNLAEALKQRGKFPPRAAAELMSKIARAVQHAHTRGVLHRDLKPGNILIDPHGEPWLTDFGLAKVTSEDSGLTLSSTHLGTPHYMAPETARGRATEVSVASDVWALGVILWELLTGQPAFGNGPTVEILRRIVDEEPTLPSGAKIDADLLTLARRCLEKSPAKRLASTGELADELDRWLRGEPIRARAVTGHERLVKWVRRKPALAALWLALAVGVVSAFFLWQRAERAVVSLTVSNDQLGTALRVATATKLAGDARLQVTEEPARALLLAVAAAEMTEHTRGGVLPEAESALVNVLQQVGGTDASVFGVRPEIDDGFLRVTWQERLTLRFSPDSRRLLTLRELTRPQPGWYASVRDVGDRDSAPPPPPAWRLFPPSEHHSECTTAWLGDAQHFLGIDQMGEVTLWECGAGPVPTSRRLGSLAREGRRMRRARLCAVPGEWPAAVVIWRSTDDVESLARVKCRPDGTFALSPEVAFPNGQTDGLAHHEALGGHLVAECGNLTASPPRLIHLDDGVAEEVWCGEGPVNASITQISPNGKSLAVATFERQLRLYALSGDAAKPSPVRVADHVLDVGSLYVGTWSTDGAWFAVTGRSGGVRLYPRDGGEPVRLQIPDAQGMSVNFSPDGRRLGVGTYQRTVAVWEMATIREARPPRVFRGMPVAVGGVEFSPDGRALAATGVQGRAARQWVLDDAGTGVVPEHLPLGTRIARNLALSPDRRWLLVGGSSEDTVDPNGGMATFMSVDGRQSLTLPPHGTACSGVAFSVDGRWLATTGFDPEVHVWETASLVAAAEAGTEAPPPRYRLPMADTRPYYGRFLAFHPRGTLYGVCGDGLLFSWDLGSADPQASVWESRVHSIGYLLPDIRISPDGRTMAIARHGWDDEPLPGSVQRRNQVLLYDVSAPGEPVFTQALKATFLGDAQLSFSADSRWLSAGSASKPVSVWDLRAADVEASVRLAPVAKQARATAISPDGRTLAFGGADGLVHLWNWESGRIRSIQTGSEVMALAWSDADHLLACGDSEHVTRWEVNLAHLKAAARRAAGRELTPEERRRFGIPER